MTRELKETELKNNHHVMEEIKETQKKLYNMGTTAVENQEKLFKLLEDFRQLEK